MRELRYLFILSEENIRTTLETRVVNIDALECEIVTFQTLSPDALEIGAIISADYRACA